MAATPHDGDEERGDRAERHEQRTRDEAPPIGDREHEESDPKPEKPAARERREHHEEEKAEHDGDRHAQTMPSLQSQIDGQQRQQRDTEHHSEMVRVGRERVRPVDGRPADRSVDVDRAGATRQRRKQNLIQIRAGSRSEQLQHAVHAVDDEAEGERCDSLPVEER